MIYKNKKDISKEMKELKETMNTIPESKRPIADMLYAELEFMQRTLATLKQQVNDEGAVSLFKQGKQEFLREHPALKAYNTTIQRYSLIYKQLVDLLPDDSTEDTDELTTFLSQVG